MPAFNRVRRPLSITAWTGGAIAAMRHRIRLPEKKSFGIFGSNEHIRNHNNKKHAKERAWPAGHFF
jgi:hypothetical protein